MTKRFKILVAILAVIAISTALFAGVALAQNPDANGLPGCCQLQQGGTVPGCCGGGTTANQANAYQARQGGCCATR